MLFRHIRENQEQSARAFGAMLRRWRERNGWTQYTAARWADESGHPGISHSGLSELENGLTRHPRLAVFLALAEQNMRVAAGDYSGVRTRALRDQLHDSQAITHPDGTPWGPTEFWECHAGLRQAPEWLASAPVNPAPLLSADQAAELCSSWADRARVLVREAGGGPADLMKIAGAAPVRHRQQWGLVALGLASYSPNELRELWNPNASEWQPSQWLEAWGRSLAEPGPNAGGSGRNPEHAALS
jgi:transcriptional regulator with XRE-family HTH domain